MKYKTVGEWEDGIQRSLTGLPFSRDLAPELQPLLSLVPAHLRPIVEFRYANGRKIREDAAAAYFEPESCEVRIRFEDRPPDAAGEPAPNSAGSDIEPEMRDLLLALAQAEARMPFVALTWFRDQYLPQRGYPWARNPILVGQMLGRATSESLVLTGQTANPKNPEHPTTTVRLNAIHPRLRGQLESQDPKPRFRPIAIRGEPLSKTVLDDRR